MSSPPAGAGIIRPGYVTGQFIFDAPSTISTPQSFVLTATSTSSPTEEGSVSITLAPSVAVTLTPASTSV